MGIISAIVGVVYGVVSAIAAAAIAHPFIALAVVAAGAYAMCGPSIPGVSDVNFGAGASPSYDSFGPRSTTISNKLPVPVILGKMKVFGNLVWQTDPGESVKQIIVLAQGPVHSITDIKINDRAYTEFSGVSITAYTGTSAQIKDSRAGDLDGLDLRYYAYLAVTLAASEELSGAATISCIVHGEMPETYNSVTDTWSGATWSENPAALIRHVLKNERWGVSKNDSEVDDDTFATAFDNFAEPVDDGAGGTEARFRLNYIMDQSLPARDHLDKMLAVCRSSFIFEGNKIRMHVNKAESVKFRFGDGSSLDTNNYNNIAEDSFHWKLDSIDNLPNRLIVHWIDPDQEYAEVTVVRENRIDQDERGKVIQKNIGLLGIQYQSQALRAAKYIEAAFTYNAVEAAWTGFLDARHLRLGDVVSVTAKAAIYQDKEFRISGISLSENGQIHFTGTEYNASLYDDRLGAAITTMPQPTGPNVFEPLSNVTAVALSEFGFQQGSAGGLGDGKHIANIDVSWTAISDDQKRRLQHHLIEYSDDSGVTYKVSGIAGRNDTAYRIPDMRVGITYNIRVKTVSDEGVVSSGATNELYIQGKDDPPSDVSTFLVNQDRDRIFFGWTEITDVDAWGYEIRWGSSWASGTLIAKVEGDSYISTNFRTGISQSYWIKAIDFSGNYSLNAKEATITIDNIPFQNVVVSYSEQTAWAGTKVNLQKAGDNLEFGYDSYTKLLIHFDGTDGATTHTAETGQTVTFVADAELDTAQKEFGTASLLLDGTGDYVTVPDSDDWSFGDGDFTVDLWVRFNHTASTQYFCGQYGSATDYWFLRYTSTNNLGIYFRTGGVSKASYSLTNGWTPVADTWYHLEFVRNGASALIFIDGVSQALTESVAFGTNDVGNVASVLGIGTYLGNSSVVNGWIDEFRMSKGIARHTANFTPGTNEYKKELTGTYLTPVRDLGYVASFKIGIDVVTSIAQYTRFDSSTGDKWNDDPSLRFTGSEAPGASSFQIITSEDNATWATGDYQAGDYKCRYFQLEMTLTRESVAHDLLCSKLEYYADLPDIDEKGSGTVSDAATGDAIIFVNTFHATPKLHVEILSGDAMYAKRVSADTTEAIIKLYDEDGVAQTGDYDYHAHSI